MTFLAAQKLVPKNILAWTIWASIFLFNMNNIARISGVFQDKGENEHMKVPKSRYSSIDLYISEKHQCFNDIPVPTNEKIRQHMLKEGKKHTMCSMRTLCST